MGFFDTFKRKPESPAEKQALENLDGVTREVASDEEDKEWERERATGLLGPGSLPLGGPARHVPSVPFHDVPGDPVPEPVDDPDPVSPGGLRGALHEHDGEV
jgi:hypothetical protein